MRRQNSDTRNAELLLLSSSALAARAERIRQVRALVAAGLYRTDAGAIARAILRDGRALRASRATAGLLDTQVSA